MKEETPDLDARRLMNALPDKMRSALLRARHFERAKVYSREHRFSCFLDAVDPADDGAADDELITNSTYFFDPAGNPPPEVVRSGAPLDAFLRDSGIAWIEDPGTDVWLPAWVDSTWSSALSMLEPGKPAPPALDPRLRRMLIAAGILVDRRFREERRSQWDAIYRSARGSYEENGYCILRDLIPPLQLSGIRRYYGAIVAAGQMPFDRDDAVDRYVIHSEILARYLHAQFQKLVERIAAEPVKQSYVFLGSYRPGAVLPRHRDRAQCEFSISFLADYVPDPTERPSGWPLYLEDPVRNTVSTVDLKVGDAVVYRGRELFHYRHALPAGHRSTSLFFHYVRPDFAGDLF